MVRKLCKFKNVLYYLEHILIINSCVLYFYKNLRSFKDPTIDFLYYLKIVIDSILYIDNK